MGQPGDPSPLMQVLRRPLRRPGRVAAVLGLSLLVAPLRVATVAALLPVLQILFREDWAARFQEQAAGLWAPLAPLAEDAAAFLTRGDGLRAMLWVFGGMLALALLRAALVVLQESLSARLVHGAAAEVAADVHDALLAGAGRDQPEGVVLSHFSADLDAVRVALRRVYGKVVREPLNAAATLVALFVLDARLALWTVLVFPPAAGVLLLLSRRLRHATRKALGRTGQLLSVVEEGLRGRRVVWAYGLEEREGSRFRDALGHLTRNLVSLDRREALASPLLEVLGLVAGVTCSLLGAAQVLSGELKPEAFLTFYMVLVTLLDPLRKLADTQVRVQRGAVAAARLQELLSTRPLRPPVHGHQPLRQRPRHLEVRDLGVVTEEGTALLRGVSFEARPGAVLLVAGASGAGKSTLLDVLAGLRPADAGQVRLDGTALADFAPGDFRQQVALVAQETFLFRGTLQENVTLGTPPRGVTLDAAAEQACLTELVRTLPQGWRTRVEDHDFSQGERQRLSFARALYRNPGVLLLDEATSALDRPTEQKILQSVRQGAAGRITLLVTHRLAPDLAVDRVLLLEGGRLVDQGTPEEMLTRSTPYRQLVEGARS